MSPGDAAALASRNLPANGVGSPPGSRTPPGAESGGVPSDLLAGEVDFDSTAEHAVVGALLWAASGTAREILALVRDTDFADPRCGFVVGVVRSLHAAGQPHDTAAVVVHVRSRGLLGPGAPRVNLALFLHELAAAAPAAPEGPWWAGKVVEQAARRRVEAAAKELLRIARSGAVGELEMVVRRESRDALAELGRVSR